MTIEEKIIKRTSAKITLGFTVRWRRENGRRLRFSDICNVEEIEAVWFQCSFRTRNSLLGPHIRFFTAILFACGGFSFAAAVVMFSREIAAVFRPFFRLRRWQKISRAEKRRARRHCPIPIRRIAFVADFFSIGDSIFDSAIYAKWLPGDLRNNPKHACGFSDPFFTITSKFPRKAILFCTILDNGIGYSLFSCVFTLFLPLLSAFPLFVPFYFAILVFLRFARLLSR